ncbi:MAG: acetylglutamate kinase [Deltaproteobacteria bacterium]|nr:acetylglutamate kinase [Deltaproteobacteria bacterium]
MLEKISVLKKAAPYLRMYKGRIFVIKLGGEIFASDQALARVTEQAALLHDLGIHIVLVHGGGAAASALAGRLGIPVEQVNGRRITSAETLEVAKMAFNGQLNTDLLAALSRQGVPAVGISGVDAGLIVAHRRPVTAVTDAKTGETRQVDFGFVGDVDEVNPEVVRHLIDGGFVPVVSSLAGGEGGAVYNVNADTVATQLAAALDATKLVLLTSAPGVLENEDDPSSVVSYMDRPRLEEVLETSATGGMKAKLEACRDALDGGVPRTHIVSGLKADSLLIEIFTNEGCGTLIEQSPPRPSQNP